MRLASRIPQRAVIGIAGAASVALTALAWPRGETASTTSGSASTTAKRATTTMKPPGSTSSTLAQGAVTTTTVPGLLTTTTTAPQVDPRWVVDMAVRPDGSGGWIVRADGSVTAFGDALDLGDALGEVHSTVVEIASTPSGNGYWIADTLGERLTFGAARMFCP